MKDQARWSEERLLSVSNAYWQGSALQAGVLLDLFTAIGSGKVSARKLAEGSGWEPRGVGMLLDALCAMGLLRKRGDLYSNTDEARKFLCKDSAHYLGYIIAHHFHLMPRWAKLPDAVRTGQPIHSGGPESEAQREAFLMGMFNMANLVAPRVAHAIDLSDRKNLLDLGGGPGAYAIHFCKMNPTLRATVYDLPPTEPYAAKTIAEYGLMDRISFQAGNYIEQALTGHYDVVWMSHILHSMGPGLCKEVIRKAVSVLDADGVLYVHDFLLNENRDGPLFPALFSLNMLVNTKEGRAYSEADITSMMKEAGLKDVKRIPFDSPNSSGLICGTK